MLSVNTAANVLVPILALALSFVLTGQVLRLVKYLAGMIRYVVINEYETGLLYENGRFLRSLSPGRYRISVWPWRRQEVTRVDMRRIPLVLSGQEMLTADALSVRLNVAAEFRVVDAVLAVHTTQSYATALYTALQILLRDEVQARTLDALLADRTALSGALLERGRAEAEALGLELTQVGVKDIILPGDVKRMLSQEIEAQRAGRAALVAAREETAATRAKANTAQILAGNPVLLRLREIEALAQVAGGMGNTVVVAVPNEIMTALNPSGGKRVEDWKRRRQPVKRPASAPAPNYLPNREMCLQGKEKLSCWLCCNCSRATTTWSHSLHYRLTKRKTSKYRRVRAAAPVRK